MMHDWVETICWLMMMPGLYFLIGAIMMLIDYIVGLPEMYRQMKAHNEAIRLEKIAMLEKAEIYAYAAKDEEDETEKAYLLSCAFDLFNIAKGSENR